MRGNPLRFTDPTGEKTDSQLDAEEFGRGLRAIAKAQEEAHLTYAQWQSLADAFSGRIPDIDETQAEHMFRLRGKYGLTNSDESRVLLRDIAKDPTNLVGIADDGTRFYAVRLPDGKQVWLQIGREGSIRDAGVNEFASAWVRDPAALGGIRRIPGTERAASVEEGGGELGLGRIGGLLEERGGTILGGLIILDIIISAYAGENDPHSLECNPYFPAANHGATCNE